VPGPANLITDGFRLLRDLLALNGRKSFWILRGRRNQAPCQHPSDSGRAAETECEACRHLRHPGRLRAVCPLLHQTPAAWYCSVSSEKVRPFWARACGTYLCLALGLYLGGATTVFGVLRLASFPGLGWWQVVWPGDWHFIPEAQSRRFVERANLYLKEERFHDAQLALASAVQSNPNNLPASVLLAQIWYMQGNAEFAEQAFERLARVFPEERTRLNLVQHDTMVAIGQGRPLAEFALSRTRLDREHYAAWVEAMLFGLRLSKSAESFFSIRLTEVAGLAPSARRLVSAEALIEEGRIDEARSALAAPFGQPWNPIYARLHVQLLIRIRAFREGSLLLNNYGQVLGNFERDLLRFELNKAAGDGVSAAADLLGLLKGTLTPLQINELCAVLVHYPDRAASNRIQAQLRPRTDTLPPDTIAALWCASQVAGATEAAAAWAEKLQRLRIELPEPPSIDFDIVDLVRPGGAPYLINTLQLPRPVVYALALQIRRK
jgi:tetratricopeptide (TPR) repeat protein